MASLLTELKRRNVFKVGVAYAIVGWILIEVSSVLGPALNLPNWVTSFVAFLLILGFPVAMLLTWAYELTPEGMKKTHAVPVSESITHATGRKIDFVIIALMAVGIGFLVLDNYVLDDASSPEVVEQTTGPGAEAGEEAVAPAAEPVVPAPVTQETEREVLPNSVAVLPFENLSLDPENAFFAAGIHEETLNQLTKLRNLSVISRTSVLRYQETDLSIPEIATELNVGTVVEGSVRYADDRVRITAQLIDAATDEHLWSEVYERNFADIFAIQSDIAMNIANALEAEFSLEEQASIEQVPTESPAAYQLYLASLEAGGDLRGDLLDHVIETDPNFALAYARRAQWYVGGLPRYLEAPGGESQVARQEALALADIERALELDPNLAMAYVALAGIHAFNWRGRDAKEAFERAYQLSPNAPDVLQSYAIFSGQSGSYEIADRLRDRVMDLEPGNGSVVLVMATRELAGDLDVAAAAYRVAIQRNPSNVTSRPQLSIVEIRRGNIAEAEALLPLAEQMADAWGGGVMHPQVAYAYAQLGLQEDVDRVLAEFETRAIERRQAAVTWVIASLARGDEALALEWLEKAAEKAPYEGYNLVFRIKANVFGSPILDKPEFVALREKLGFTDL